MGPMEGPGSAPPATFCGSGSFSGPVTVPPVLAERQGGFSPSALGFSALGFSALGFGGGGFGVLPAFGGDFGWLTFPPP